MVIVKSYFKQVALKSASSIFLVCDLGSKDYSHLQNRTFFLEKFFPYYKLSNATSTITTVKTTSINCQFTMYQENKAVSF